MILLELVEISRYERLILTLLKDGSRVTNSENDENLENYKGFRDKGSILRDLYYNKKIDKKGCRIHSALSAVKIEKMG